MNELGFGWHDVQGEMHQQSKTRRAWSSIFSQPIFPILVCKDFPALILSFYQLKQGYCYQKHISCLMWILHWIWLMQGEMEFRSNTISTDLREGKMGMFSKAWRYEPRRILSWFFFSSVQTSLRALWLILEYQSHQILSWFYDRSNNVSLLIRELH